MRRRLVVTATLVTAAAAFAVGAVALRTAPRASARIRAPAWVQAASGRHVAFTLALRLPGAARLQAALAAQGAAGDQASVQVITPRAFGQRFGLPQWRLTRLVTNLRRRGVSVLAAYPQRTELRVSASVATIERVFGVRLEVSRTGGGLRRAVGRTVVPPDLSAVSAVTGLDTRPHWRSWDVPPSGLTPDGAGAAYDVAPLRAAGMLGQGLTIAVISFSDYDHSEPATFARRYGLSGPAPQIVPIDGGTFDLSGADETNLDIDVIRSLAPGARLLIYEVGQSSSGLADALNAIVARRSAAIVSTSWGQCELGVDRSELTADRQAIVAARAVGISIFAATGDTGAFDCQAGNLPDHRLSVDWPAASAGVIAVGGTRLKVGTGGAYGSESAWEDALSGQGSGGGFSQLETRPPWQRALGQRGSPGRALPDVAADADPGTGWSFYSAGRWGSAGGTSAAAPFWAASMLLISQYAAGHGVRRLGFVAPLLYALAAGRQRFPAFHDIGLGSNRYYQAAPGWDPATGLGSPDVYDLARDIIAHVRAHPARRRRGVRG